MADLKLNEGNKGVFKKELIRNPKVKAGETKYGYGLYAVDTIKAGEIIEECVIASDRLSPNTHDFDSYKFRGKEISKGIFDSVVVLGNASLLNHSDTLQNVNVFQNPNYERLIVVVAAKDIFAGQELYWYYGY